MFPSIARMLQGAHGAPKHMLDRLEARSKVTLQYMLAQKTLETSALTPRISVFSTKLLWHLKVNQSDYSTVLTSQYCYPKYRQMHNSLCPPTCNNMSPLMMGYRLWDDCILS